MSPMTSLLPPPSEQGNRRGIAGTFTVYKIAAAAAEDGVNLDEVERVMTKANAATYSFGVAFAGCTMPGADQPLFVVEPGQMDFGLGIHGEPGISSAPWMNAKDLATKLVQTVLAERPGGGQWSGGGAGQRAWRNQVRGVVCAVRRRRGVVASRRCGAGRAGGWRARDEPRYGGLLAVASRGWTRSWRATGQHRPTLRPSAAAASKRVERSPQRRTVTEDAREHVVEEASEESIAAAAIARDLLRTLSETVETHKDYLGQLDAVAGDGDHGIGMSRGAKAAAEAAAQTEGGVQTVLAAAGAAFGDRAGGTSGILWGMLIDGVGKALGNTEAVTAERLADAVHQSATNLKSFSKAELGDKTMLDALFPFVDTFVSEVRGGAPLDQRLGVRPQ